MKKLHKLCALLLSMAMAISCASLPAVAAEVGVSEETVVVSTDTEETTEEESEEDPAEEEGADASEEESTEEEATEEGATEEEAADSSEEAAEESAEEEATVEAAEAEEAEEADASVEAESTVPTATAESTLFGYGYTDGLSCLMGSTIDSLTGEATISLALDEGEIDDSLIDSSNATVKLVDGDGYYAAELILSATTLTGNWENGQTSYTMSVEDLVWNNDVYSGTVGDAGTRQWSAFGGDGNGCYTFYLEVSGITYNGQEVASTTFPVEVYIFGRDGTDRGTVFDTEVTLPTATESSSGKSQSSETQWTWSGDSSAGVPILCDSLADDFYITWPSGSDASGVTASDVTVTLSNEYGTTYTLETENAYGEQQYAVYSSKGETQVAVTFMHWSYTPVFTTMTITVDGGDGLTATKTYEVASVYAYVIQSGGRARGDGNVVTFSYYGLDLDSLTSVYQLAKDTEDYTLYTTVDDTTYYYAEDESGNGYLTTDEDEAAVYTQSTEVREPALVNATVFIENRLTLTEDKTVDGETVTFTKELGNGDGNNTLYMKGADVLANGVKAATGYVIGENLTPYDGNGDRYGTLMPYEHWAWQTRFSAGWTSEDGETATSFPYVSFPYGYAAGETPSTGDDEEEEEPVEVSVTAESDIFGSADTGNKSTLKAELVYTSGPGDINLYYYNEDGERVQYEDQSETHEGDTVTYTGSATISLALAEGEIDDSKIDSSNAVVKLAEGDGYYPEELVLAATSLTGSWENGQLTYTLAEGDLEWYTGDYEWSDFNSGREWSCFGGDGNGYYTFNFEVSGITYDGVEVDPVQFQVNVYIWGRDGSDRVSTFNETESPEAVESTSGVSQTDEIQWTWSGDTTTGDPILCDNLADDFYITWPTGTDASGLTADDVTVTLYNAYGDSYTLQTENAYGEKQYSVFSSEGETQVAVTFMHWAYVPVFTTMTITVDGDGLTASKTYDVDSVYIYMVQQGGGGVTVDGTVTTYSYYGFANLDSVWQVMTESTYILTTTIDDTTYYYAEDGTLTTDKSAAQSFDATGEADTNQQLIGNTAWITTRLNQTEDKTVDGETITFDKSYSTGKTASASTAAANGLVAADGYILGSSITPYEMWAWQDRFLAGYTTSEAEPTGSPYVSFPYGYEAGETPSTGGDEEGESVEISATAESTLFGYAYTDGLSCLMSETIDSLTGEATISLALSEGDVDDSLIDSSNATVKLAEGDGYYADELTLGATTLTGSWENGQISYTLDVEDLVWNNTVFTEGYSGGTREWSCFGGDGNGCYTFNLEVSGITYNGQEVPSVTFQVEVYIFGRSGADLAALYNLEEDAVAVESTSGVSQTDEIQWTWSGDTSAGIPILCDNQTDDFYITWPTGSDASGLTAEDVTVTLYSEYGDSYALQTENAYGEKQYAVFSSEGETQVAVMFRHWAYVPVFTTMTITVDGNELTASKTYDIGSVYVHMVQSGGHPAHDGDVVTFSYYGLDADTLTSVWQLAKAPYYTLTTTVDNTTYYYAETEDGTGYLTEDADAAATFDATDDRTPTLVGSTVFLQNRLNQTETKTVDGEDVTFDKVYAYDDGDDNVYKTGEALTANGVEPAAGYVMWDTGYEGTMWSWQDRFLSGWTEEDGTTATSLPYVSFPYGYEADSTGGETETVDTTALTTAIEQAEALTESDYTASTWAALQTALESAKTVAANADAAQTEVDEATAALTAAIDALEKANTTEEVTVPAATTITSAVSWTKGIKLTWEAVDGATSYQVYRKIDSGSWKKVKTTSSTTWQDTGATTDSTQYQYKVYAVNSSGKSEASATKTIFRLASTTITSATNRATGVKLTWNAVEGATSYRIFRKVGNGSWKKVKTTSSTTWTDTSATKNGTKYQYKIDAVNSSDISAASATKTIYRLTAKKFTRAKNVSSRKISLKWTRNTQATGYIIQYSTSSSFSSSTTKTVKVKGNKNVTTTLKNLTKGKKYYIRMRAYKTSGSVTSYAGWSKVKTVTVKK